MKKNRITLNWQVGETDEKVELPLGFLSHAVAFDANTPEGTPIRVGSRVFHLNTVEKWPEIAQHFEYLLDRQLESHTAIASSANSRRMRKNRIQAVNTAIALANELEAGHPNVGPFKVKFETKHVKKTRGGHISETRGQMQRNETKGKKYRKTFRRRHTRFWMRGCHRERRERSGTWFSHGIVHFPSEVETF
jgi:hypothetical protein